MRVGAPFSDDKKRLPTLHTSTLSRGDLSLERGCLVLGPIFGLGFPYPALSFPQKDNILSMYVLYNYYRVQMIPGGMPCQLGVHQCSQGPDLRLRKVKVSSIYATRNGGPGSDMIQCTWARYSWARFSVRSDVPEITLSLSARSMRFCCVGDQACCSSNSTRAIIACEKNGSNRYHSYLWVHQSTRFHVDCSYVWYCLWLFCSYSFVLCWPPIFSSKFGLFFSSTPNCAFTLGSHDAAVGKVVFWSSGHKVEWDSLGQVWGWEHLCYHQGNLLI